jgi:hypothetical protein
MKRLKSPSVVLEMDLVPRRAVKGRTPKRADLTRDGIAPKEREGAPGDGGTPELEVDGHTAGPAEVNASRSSNERRKLGESAAGLPRVDGCELTANRGGECHATSTPSRANSRRLYSVPSEPYDPSPVAETTRWHGTTTGKRLPAQ